MVCEASLLEGDVDGPMLVCPDCGRSWYQLGTDRLLPDHTRQDEPAGR